MLNSPTGDIRNAEEMMIKNPATIKAFCFICVAFSFKPSFPKLFDFRHGHFKGIIITGKTAAMIISLASPKTGSSAIGRRAPQAEPAMVAK